LTKFINFYCYFCKNIIHQLQTRRLGDGCLWYDDGPLQTGLSIHNIDMFML
jgi:hypothetical protein